MSSAGSFVTTLSNKGSQPSIQSAERCRTELRPLSEAIHPARSPDRRLCFEHFQNILSSLKNGGEATGGVQRLAGTYNKAI